MRALPLVFLACLLAGRIASAQTLDDAAGALEKKEYEKARVILEKLSMQGDPEAEFRLAEMYVRPIGIPRNTVRGFTLYQSAANKSHAQAQFVLATEYMKGELVPADRNRAMGLMRTSAKLKNAGAQYAMCLEQSTGGSAFYDIEEAYAWCEASAKKKHKFSGEAERRGKEVLRKIDAGKKPGAVDAARIRAASYVKLY